MKYILTMLVTTLLSFSLYAAETYQYKQINCRAGGLELEAINPIVTIADNNEDLLIIKFRDENGISVKYLVHVTNCIIKN